VGDWAPMKNIAVTQIWVTWRYMLNKDK